MLRIENEPVMLGALIAQVCREFTQVHKIFSLAFVDSGVDRNEDFSVYGRSDLLENAIRALFSNAARAVVSRSNEMGPTYAPFVRYELHRQPPWMVLSVIDNGGGIPRNVQDRLFDPFNKGELNSGHGLGLFYSATVAEALGGRLVLVRNSIGETRFDLILRLFEEDDRGNGQGSYVS